MSVCLTQLLYNKTGVYRGIHYFLIFALKHILWVPTIYVLSKNIKKVKRIQLKIVIFTAVKNRCILHGLVFVMAVLLLFFTGDYTWPMLTEPRHVKTGLRGVRPGPTQTGLYSH